ncbi:MAG TPA: helix-turn-helix domain-containing protein [Pyrinomonadaceae bacterium]|jgi:DNA-binding NtrC family response regulator|nr:helix-turn-helix domain-containing protein [Pyrinomonadaceae bacterium]
MNLLTHQSSPATPNGRAEVKRTSLDTGTRTAVSTRTEVKKAKAETPALLDAGIVSLKILAGALINRIESLGKGGEDSTVLNLQREVHRFEAELIRMALIETGGRQRRAAKLLGLKATTLSTKIKRHRIHIHRTSTMIDPPTEDPTIPDDLLEQ